MKKKIVKAVCVAGALMVSLALFASCGAKKAAEKREITVMVPPWAEPPADALEAFTADTGIKVVMNIVGWDEIRNKVSIAAVGKTAPADVMEVDWSWTGEFGAAGWLEPLTVSDAEKAQMPTIASFTYDGKVLALPYANDFRLAYYNTEHFAKAGITEAPKTWTDVVAAAKKIKAMGIREYPLAMTLSASEAATTSLFWMTLSGFGEFFNPDFTVNKDNVLGALTFTNNLLKNDKLIDPASQNMKDVEVYGKLLSGDASFMIGPTSYTGRINNPELSQVVGKAKAALVPGAGSRVSATFALPEGIGISAFSKNKEAARTFIDWFTSPEIQVRIYETRGIIPTRTAALQKLVDTGAIKDGGVLIEESGYIASPFPGGIPHWYAEMSNAIYNSVNRMVSGSLTPEQAYEAISQKVAELAK